MNSKKPAKISTWSESADEQPPPDGGIRFQKPDSAIERSSSARTARQAVAKSLS